MRSIFVPTSTAQCPVNTNINTTNSNTESANRSPPIRSHTWFRLGFRFEPGIYSQGDEYESDRRSFRCLNVSQLFCLFFFPPALFDRTLIFHWSLFLPRLIAFSCAWQSPTSTFNARLKPREIYLLWTYPTPPTPTRS